MKHQWRFSVFLLVSLLLFGTSVQNSALNADEAQQSTACSTPVSIPSASQPNIFSPQEEIALGDIFAQSLDAHLAAIDDDALTGHLRAIGDRLSAQLPVSGLHFRFYLSDAPQANAFSIAGGRIYVTRKMVSFLRSEDELAAVIGHEMGHIVTHQSAIENTGLLQQLQVSHIDDINDVFDKVNLIMESKTKLKRNPELPEKDQLAADQAGLEAVARAGYDPQAFFAFFDRLAETKGKTGTWFSELMKSTPPNSKRLREISKEISGLSHVCGQPRNSGDAEGFAAWRARVLHSTGSLRKPIVQNVVWKKFLDPPLVDDFRNLRFSPDGKFLLAQDGSSIYVLTRDPLEFVFRIDAPSAHPAQFTPDSGGVVFYDPQLRVEHWDIASKERVDINEVVIQKGCFQTRLSPDGRTLACFRRDLDLLLVDVVTGDQILEKEKFYQAEVNTEQGIGSFIFSFQLRYITMEFSPDGRHFVASSKNGNPIAYDLSSRSIIPVRGSLKTATATSFVFVTPDEIAGSAGSNGTSSLLVSFPSGAVIRQLNFGSARPSRVAHGDYVLLRPIKDFAVGVLDLKTNDFVRANKQAAFDVYDKTFVSQLKSGEIGLFQESSTPIATLKLPLGPLGNLRTADISEDWNLIAVSFRDRGGVWDLKAGQILYNLRGFWRGWFNNQGSLYAEFPKEGTIDRSIAQINLSTHNIAQTRKLESPDIELHGRYLVTLHAPNKPPSPAKDESGNFDSYDYEGLNIRVSDMVTSRPENQILDVDDVQSNNQLWAFPFPKEVPRVYWSAESDRAVFVWRASDSGVRAEQQRVPDARHRTTSNKYSFFELEIIDLTNGKPLGWIEVDTHDGAFGISYVGAAGDYVVVRDTMGRLLMYSISTGKLLGRFLGHGFEIVPGSSPVLCVHRQKGRLEFYQPGNWAPIATIRFPWPISMVRFTPDGKQLFALTDDQVAYMIDISSIAAKALSLASR
ncbi:MAG: M48 family metalloprotease [Candidatus Acidiferrales bacterium]